MKQRSPVAVLLLPFITFGIYSLYWMVKTKGEMNKLGAQIPTAWLIIVPIVNIWWYWKYSEGVEQITQEKLNGVLAFLLLFLLGFIGEAIIQDYFNKLSAAPAVAEPVAPAQPVSAPPATPTDTPPTPPTQPVV